MTKSKPNPKKIIKTALKKGIQNAEKISPKKDVFTGKWVRTKCQYGCGGYGNYFTCPPYSPSPKQTQQLLNEYEVGILLHTASDGLDISNAITDLEKEAFLAGYYKAFGIKSGPCELCDECNIPKKCKHPQKARPSMEACGIDVYKTVRNLGLEINVVKNKKQEQNYYGLLLLE